MTTKEKLIIVGNTNFAELTTYYLQEYYEIIAYTVDKAYINSNLYMQKPLVDFNIIESIYPPNEYLMFVAAGYNKRNTIRENLYKRAKEKGYNLISYIHKSCIIDKNVEIGDNCFFFERNVIQPNVKIGNACIIWANSTICHSSILKDYIFVGSNACINGFIEINNNAFIGANATIRNNLTIAKNTLVGAGCTIQESTEEGNVFKNNTTIKLTK